MHPELDTYAQTVLGGPTTVVADRSWAHGKSVVLEVLDADGGSWFLKQHRHMDWYRSEVSAYRRWVPALGGRAPALRASDDDTRVLVLSALHADGSGDWRDQTVQRDAGALLRRLHDLETLGRWDDIATDKLAQLERLAARANGLFAARELDFVSSELRALRNLAVPARVACHLDYSPRNWLVAKGEVHVLDFEDAAPEVWINDLGRLYFGWWRDPLSRGRHLRAGHDLQEAFFDGYGRHPNAEELALLLASYALAVVRYVIIARELGQADHEAALRHVLEGLMGKEFG